MLLPGIVAAGLASAPLEIIGEQTVLPVDFDNSDAFSRAFTLNNGPIDASLTVYTVIAYNDTDSTNPDSFPVAYTGTGINDWYDIGVGPFSGTNVRFDLAGSENGPDTDGTYIGAGPWNGTTDQESASSNGFWYYIQVQVFNVGATQNSTADCYCKATAA